MRSTWSSVRDCMCVCLCVCVCVCVCVCACVCVCVRVCVCVCCACMQYVCVVRARVDVRVLCSKVRQCPSAHQFLVCFLKQLTQLNCSCRMHGGKAEGLHAMQILYRQTQGRLHTY